MDIETDAPQGGTEGEAVAETSTVETTPEATAGQPETGAENPEIAEDAGAETEQPKRTPWFQKRIDEVTAQKHEAAREAAYWRGIAEGRTPQQEQPQQEAVPDRWDDPEGYDRWLISQAARHVREELKREQTTSTFAERVAKAREARPDYDAVVSNPALPITDLMADVIKESELGPDVAYHLGTNPQEAARIAGLPPHLQAKELGKLEAKLSQPAPQAPPRKDPPPAPPQTVAGISTGATKAPEDMSMAEYIAARNAGQI